LKTSLKKALIALGLVMAVALGAPRSGSSRLHLRLLAGNTDRQSNLIDFSHWAVVLVAGDYRAHSGAPSKVFDNARHDLAQAFAKIGFSKANMAQFSVDYDDGTQHTGVPEIAAAMQTVASRAKDGCLIYSLPWHAHRMLIGDAILSPAQMRDMVNSSCGSRPTVVVMSSCYSAVRDAACGDSRIIMTAARPDRTSFGCGELDHYTFSMIVSARRAMAGDFPAWAIWCSNA